MWVFMAVMMCVISSYPFSLNVTHIVLEYSRLSSGNDTSGVDIFPLLLIQGALPMKSVLTVDIAHKMELKLIGLKLC